MRAAWKSTHPPEDKDSRVSCAFSRQCCCWIKKTGYWASEQLTSIKAQHHPKTKASVTKMNTERPTKHDTAEPHPTADQRPSSRPKPCYCFQCGEDGHTVPSCPNDRNPTLTAAKRKQLKEKQSLWDSQNSSVHTQPLNWIQPSMRDKWELNTVTVPPLILSTNPRKDFLAPNPPLCKYPKVWWEPSTPLAYSLMDRHAIAFLMQDHK